MFMQSDIPKVKKSIEKFIGSRVMLESGKGRQSLDTREGIIQDVYQSIFIVQLYDKCVPAGRVSYNYTDVLTKTVKITICD